MISVRLMDVLNAWSEDRDDQQQRSASGVQYIWTWMDTYGRREGPSASIRVHKLGEPAIVNRHERGRSRYSGLHGWTPMNRPVHQRPFLSASPWKPRSLLGTRRIRTPVGKAT
jgi:hypothetical protein